MADKEILKLCKSWFKNIREIDTMFTAIADERQKRSDLLKDIRNTYQQLKKLKGE